MTQVMTSAGSSPQTVTVELKAGWNFFALPVVPSSLSMAAIFGTHLASVKQVSRFNPGSGTWEHSVKEAAFNQFDALEVGRGYAVYLTAPVTLTVTGAPTSGSLSLPAGKALIGNPTPQRLTVAQLLTDLRLGVDVTGAWRYNGTSFVALSQADPVAVGEAVFVQLPAAKPWPLPSSTTTTHFRYDGDGDRVKLISPEGTTLFLGQSYEVGPDGRRTKSVFAGSQRIAAVAQSPPPGAPRVVRYYHGDHLGSSNVLTDGAGQLVALYEYTPYGSLAVAQSPEPGAPSAFTFTGKRLDPTGFYFYEARYYDPSLGRFLTPDTIVWAPHDPQDLNRYAYARNNPLNLTDPTGHGFWKKVKKFFRQTVESIKGYLHDPGDFFKRKVLQPLISAGIAFAVSGGNPIAAVAAAATTRTLDTGEGRQFIRRAGQEFFDDVLGMRPSTAYRFAAVTTYMAVNMGYQLAFANLTAPNQITGTEPYDPTNPQDVAAAQDIIKQGGYRSYGGVPYVDPKGVPTDVSHFLVADGVKVGAMSKGLDIFGHQHIGIVMKGLPQRLAMETPLNPISFLKGYGIGGLSHQMVNQTLLAAGYRTTILGIGGGWSTIPSTFVYGPYGGGLTGSLYFQQESR